MKLTYLFAAAILAATLLTIGSTGHASVSRRISTQDLVGMNASDLLRTLGPPVEIDGGRDLTFWTYAKSDGSNIENAVWLVDDIVVRVHDALPIPREDRGIPAEGPYLGQHVRETVTRLGSPDEKHLLGQAGATLTFGRIELSFRDGRVVGLTAKS